MRLHGVCNDAKTASFLEDNFYHALAFHHIEYKEDIPRISKMLKRHRILQKIKHGKHGFHKSKNEILRLPMEYLLVFGGRHCIISKKLPYNNAETEEEEEQRKRKRKKKRRFPV